MFNFKNASAARSSGPILFDPRRFQDPLASQIDWNPAVSARYKMDKAGFTHRGLTPHQFMPISGVQVLLILTVQDMGQWTLDYILKQLRGEHGAIST